VTTASPKEKPPAGIAQVIPPLTLLAFLPRQHHVEIQPPAPLPTRLSDRDRKLVRAASKILRAAEDKGTPLGQMALARELRAQGLAIANERLAWLIQAAAERPPVGRPPSAPGHQAAPDPPAEPLKEGS
jgi:hypothetical protein